MEFEGRTRIRPGFDVAPLVDVVFLLHIFFLLTMTYAAPKALGVSLPSSSAHAASRQSAVTVVIDRNDAVRLEGEPVTEEVLRERLTPRFSRTEGLGAEIAADSRASVQGLVHVLDALRQAGASDVSVLTRDSAVP